MFATVVTYHDEMLQTRRGVTPHLFKPVGSTTSSWLFFILPLADDGFVDVEALTLQAEVDAHCIKGTEVSARSIAKVISVRQSGTYSGPIRF